MKVPASESNIHVIKYLFLVNFIEKNIKEGIKSLPGTFISIISLFLISTQ